MRRPLFIIAVCAALALLAYGIFIEPNTLHITHLAVRNKPISTILLGKKALLISDLHARSDLRSLDKVFTVIQERKPDIIFLTGDYVEWSARPETYRQVRAFLAKLQAPLGVFAVIGDADHSNSRQSCFFCHTMGEEIGPPRHSVKFLKNQCRSLTTETGKIAVCGCSDDDSQQAAGILSSLPTDQMPAIILSHTSTIYDQLPADRDLLVLAGDSHGGQIYLPRFLWPFFRIVPDPAHLYGAFYDGRKTLYVTSGIGTSWLPFRLGRPPEIVELLFQEDDHEK